jgi:hypothetical protein
MSENVTDQSRIQASNNGPELAENRIIEHPDEDQLSPEFFRLDQSELDQPVAKTIITNLSVRKPYPLEFFQVHPDENYRSGPVPFIALKESREYYLVAPALRRELRPREYWIGQVFLAINRLDKPFFWIITTQSPTGRISDWYNSALECAERAMHQWVQLVADQSAGGYTVSLAEDVLEEPQWPEQSFDELFKIGFKRRTVTSLDHPIFKQLRGRA